MPPMLMAHETDPAEDLQRAIGNLDSVDLFHNQILVAIYKRPEKTRSGIIITDQTRDEDEHQGKVGLIVKTGPAAFRPETDAEGNIKPSLWSWADDMGLGQWIFFRAADGWGIKINGVMCRILDDVRVRGRVSSPDQVW